VTARLGIAYDDLRPLRPELIHASITGFGNAGPWSQRPDSI
jgi:crotonobetainyl-CoA:carnitine CoA-transferase CaiB-like acyl-CoA transferase